MSRRTRRVALGIGGLIGLLLVAVGALAALGLREDVGDSDANGQAPSAWEGATLDSQIERGAYLAQVGNCVGCHTVRGQPAFSGGRPVPTPYGTLYSTNLTADLQHGLGQWSADDFWRAMHHGKSRDGRLLYPAFPFTDYTRTTRADADAIFAFLKSLPPVAQANRAPQMRFPFDQRWLLAIWRGLYFRPGVYQPDPTRGDEWNRGAYLVQGLGHCGACHTPRGSLGASQSDRWLAGGMIPELDWYAPGLGAIPPPSAPGTARLPASAAVELPGDPHVWVELLQSGVSERGAVVGPMAEVVRNSLQHLDVADVRAISTYLQSLPAVPPEPTVFAQRGSRLSPVAMERGAKLYADHCADCHGENGEGMGTAYPRLAGNRALTHEPAVNAMRILLNGGFAPGTKLNPRPYGMPPFAPTLDDQQAADVITYIRNAWGNQGGSVQSYEINRYRSAPPD